MSLYIKSEKTFNYTNEYSLDMSCSGYCNTLILKVPRPPLIFYCATKDSLLNVWFLKAGIHIMRL